MGAGTIATLLGCGAPCERYWARGVISVRSEPKPGNILDTGGGAVSCLISESLGKRWDRGTTGTIAARGTRYKYKY